MKKLMFLMVVVVGFCANAAMIKWGAEVVSDGAGGEAPDGWLAYFVEGDARDSALSKLANNDYSFLSGAYTAETDGGEIAGTISGLGNGVTKQGFMVIFNADDTADATYAYVTTVKSGSTTALGGSGQINWDIEDATASYANWTSLSGGSGGDVPEPTSGLLLLVGGAMLALRRRRA